LKRIKEEDEAKKKKNGSKKSGFRKHAVVQATSEGKAYAIINETIFGALRIFLAFLTCNALLGRKRIIFLSGGDNSIRDNILKIFSFLGSTAIILDYKHAIIKATQLGLATLRELCFSCRMFPLISSNAKKDAHP
jgi:hypothetical protein